MNNHYHAFSVKTVYWVDIVYGRVNVAVFTGAVSSPRGCSSKSLPWKQRRLWWRDDVTVLAANQLTSRTTLVTTSSMPSSFVLHGLLPPPTTAKQQYNLRRRTH